MKRVRAVAITGPALMIMAILLIAMPGHVENSGAALANRAALGYWGPMPDASSTCDQSPSNAPSSATTDLDEVAADWGVFCEGAPAWTKANVSVPSVDGQSLRCGITGGSPYSNVHCYRNLLPVSSAITFTLTLSFWFSPTTTFNNQGGVSIIQALEFTMSAWRQAQRYEFAVQWQNVGVGAPQWRYWDPNRPAAERWISLGITDTGALQLAGRQWHTLTLEGAITGGNVRYQRFKIDTYEYTLDISVLPASAAGHADLLAVAVQLDGNANESPYDVFIDTVSLVTTSPFQTHLPLVIR